MIKWRGWLRPWMRPIGALGGAAGGGGSDNHGKAMLYRVSANSYYVFVPRDGGQMVLFEFVNNVTTTNNSLATTAADTTRFRLSKVQTATDVYVSQRTASAVSGAFTDNRSLGNTAPMQAWNTGTLPKFDSTVVSGAYKEYTVTPVNGRISVTLRQLASGTSSATVKINGVDVEVVNLVGSTALVTKTYSGYSGPATVRITNGTSGEMGIVGINFQTLRAYDGSAVDSVGWGRNTTSYVDYLTNNSSNDSVALEYGSAKYGGGYHGGETSIVDTFLVNSAPVSLTVDGQFALGAVEIRGTCTVDWSAFGGGFLSWDTRWTFPLGAVEMHATVSGRLRAIEFYTVMGGWNTTFSQVTAPLAVDLTAVADMSRNRLGNVGLCTLQNPTTLQRIASTFGKWDRAQNIYGGPHVWKVSASYHKLYDGPVMEGDMTITGLTFRTRHTFY